ncbi:MAG: 2-dehydropantoate 2-reductase N-terminal domain-containing protein [Nocardioides sp.]|uniref:ketopantoate reductase family protein n=1 Tax=Nocardioides sp. TaxID=35761 RepID=UPI0039E38D1D
MARYVIIGAGAVGAAIAAGLDEAGIDVVLVSRGSTYAAIAAHGLTYTQDGRTRTLDLTVVDGADGVELAPDDVLVLAVKSQDAAATLADWAWRPVAGGGVAADLPLLLTQNGLDAERAALRYFATVVGGVTLVAGSHVVPGTVQIGTAPRIGQLIIGAYPSAAAAPGADAVAREIAEDLTKGNWLSEAVPEIDRWLAWKVLANATFAVSVLDGTPAELDRLRAGIVAEVRAVLGAAGYDFADPAELSYDRSEAGIHPSYGDHKPSTWQSFARGSGSEVDFLNGEVVLLARAYAVDAPLNTALQRVLGRSAALGEGPGVHTVAEVLGAGGIDERSTEGAVA